MESEISNLINMVFKLGDWVNTIWSFHIVVGIGLLGWLFTHRQNWNAGQKVLVSVLFLTFVGINLYSQIRTHWWLSLSINELKMAVNQTPLKTKELNDAIQSYSTAKTWQIVLMHAVADLIVILSIWTDFAWIRSVKESRSLNLNKFE
jgi:hypothetical protein